MPGQEHLGSLRRVARAALFGALAFGASCADPVGPTPIVGPFTTDVDAARAAWVQYQPKSYWFEVSFQALEWGPQSEYQRIVVENGSAVGDLEKGLLPLTIEQHWKAILEAKANGSLKSAKFTLSGIPVEWLIDIDQVADDSYKVWIRAFGER